MSLKMEDLPVMPFEMKNLRSFPMEQSCFDLKLEMLEQMGAKDVVELTKVNQGFQGMLVKDPSIVFGQHVSCIQLYMGSIGIWKFSNSNAMELNVNAPFSHFSFIKKIRSCDKLWLESGSKEDLERFFSNFRASIKKEAKLNIYCSAFNDQVIKDWVENFMVGPPLKDCEKIGFDCRTEDSFRFFYNALLNSEIKNVSMRAWGRMDLIVQQIITIEIPSKNPEAAIFLDSYDIMMDLSLYPGMRRIDEENRPRLPKQANDLARNFRDFGYSSGFDLFREESSMFRRRFDSTKDCICVYRNDGPTYFLAFYVPVN